MSRTRSTCSSRRRRGAVRRGRWSTLGGSSNQIASLLILLAALPRAAIAAEDEELSAPVHVEADRPVTLERFDDVRQAWVFACGAPCDAALPQRAKYRFVGREVRSSGTFALGTASGKRLSYRVSTVSTVTFNVGLGLALGGGAAFIVGEWALTINELAPAIVCLLRSNAAHSHCDPRARR